MARSTGAKEKVERAALDLFAVKGFDGVSIAEIAAAAGVSEGALYRHYPGKDALAWGLFSTAYLQMGERLNAIRADRRGLAARIAAVMTEVCGLYDQDPALFRFMLLTQHDLLARIPDGTRTPVEAIIDMLADAVAGGEISEIDPAAAAAALMGVVLQTATFHAYGRLDGSLLARAPSLARAAVAAINALG